MLLVFFAHRSQSTMFYLLWHTRGTLNHLHVIRYYTKKMWGCFQFIVTVWATLVVYEWLTLLAHRSPVQSGSVGTDENIGIQLDRFYNTSCQICAHHSQPTMFYLLWHTCGILIHLHAVKICAHCSQPTMSYLLWHTCGTLNHLYVVSFCAHRSQSTMF